MLALSHCMQPLSKFLSVSLFRSLTRFFLLAPLVRKVADSIDLPPRGSAFFLSQICSTEEGGIKLPFAIFANCVHKKLIRNRIRSN